MYLKELPIHRVETQTEKEIQNDIVSQVKRMLELQQRLTPLQGLATSERDDIQQRIGRTDEEIDSLVYDLYGLTTAERAMVGESG